MCPFYLSTIPSFLPFSPLYFLSFHSLPLLLTSFPFSISFISCYLSVLPSIVSFSLILISFPSSPFSLFHLLLPSFSSFHPLYLLRFCLICITFSSFLSLYPPSLPSLLSFSTLLFPSPSIPCLPLPCLLSYSSPLPCLYHVSLPLPPPLTVWRASGRPGIQGQCLRWLNSERRKRRRGKSRRLLVYGLAWQLCVVEKELTALCRLDLYKLCPYFIIYGLYSFFYVFWTHFCVCEMVRIVSPTKSL